MKHRTVHLVTLLLVMALAVAASAQPGPPGTPAKSGTATFTFNGAAVTYGKVGGTFNQSYGYTAIGLNFSKDGNPGSDHLSINLMVQGLGKVDLNAPFGNGIGVWKGGAIFSYEKGKSVCDVVLAKVSATEVEGTAECPTLNELNGSRTASLTHLKFSAKTN